MIILVANVGHWGQSSNTRVSTVGADPSWVNWGWPQQAEEGLVECFGPFGQESLTI